MIARLRLPVPASDTDWICDLDPVPDVGDRYVWSVDGREYKVADRKFALPVDRPPFVWLRLVAS